MLKLLRFLKPYRLYIILIWILLFIQSIAELYLPTLMADIIDKGIVKGDNAYITNVGIRMLIIAFVGSICSLIAILLASVSSMGFGKNLRKKLFEHVSKFSSKEFDKLGTASLITRNTNDVTQIQMVLLTILRTILGAPLLCIGALFMALNKDVQLSWVLIIVMPIIIVFALMVALKVIPIFKLVQEKIDFINIILKEYLSGIKVIRGFNKEKYEKKRFDNANVDLMDKSVKVFMIFAMVTPFMTLIVNLTTVAIVWFGSIRINSGNFQVGDLMAFLQYSMQIMISILMTSMMIVLLPRAQASANRINEILEIEPSIIDNKTTIECKKASGYIEFKNVTFKYDEAESPAVQNINFTSKPGQITSIVGGTGAGKSTIINLLNRFYNVNSGEIFIDGESILDMSQECLYEKLSLVPQNTVLFTGTIEENIKFGNENLLKSELEKVCDIAQVTEFIEKMDSGFQTYISQGGKNLSGGQKQRLAIARALAKKSKIYVFDDSFSALDFKTELKLRLALKNELLDSTIIIVAQRISTIMDSHQIVVLDEGKIVGIGIHEELLKSCKVYSEIVSSQLSTEETV